MGESERVGVNWCQMPENIHVNKSGEYLPPPAEPWEAPKVTSLERKIDPSCGEYACTAIVITTICDILQVPKVFLFSVCGYSRKKKSRIVGGRESEKYVYPWQAGLMNQLNQIGCGGA